MKKFILLVLLAALTTYNATAQNENGPWVATWATALRQAPPLASSPVGQPFTAAQQAQLGFNNQTVRMIAPVSIGGGRVRVQLSNAFGATPLAIGAAHVALRAKESAIVPGSDRMLMFSGQPGFTIPPGASALSDPVTLEVPPLAELAISVFVDRIVGLRVAAGLVACVSDARALA